MTYLSKYGYVIKKDEVSQNEILELQRELVAKPTGTSYGDTVTAVDPYILYTETVSKIYVPKMYGINKFGRTKELPSYTGSEAVCDFVGSLYEEQQEAANVLLNELTMGSGGGILSLGTGHGKTVTCLYVLAQLKKKAIIVVNKITLMKQWEDEIKMFMPNAKVGCIQGQKNVDVNNKDIVIAMLQSLARIDYPISLFSDIGVTVVDECHNVSSRVFSRVLMRLASKYTIGLTATPQRSDGCEYVFKWFLGDIVYVSKPVRKGKSPIVNMVKLDSKNYKEHVRQNAYSGKEQIQFTTMLSDLVAMETRNIFIVERIKKLVLEENRRILVLSDRRDHVKTLKALMDGDKECLNFTYGLFIGGMKMADLDKSKASQVILATYNAFGEGVSEKDLNTLLLTTPKKFIGHLQNSKTTKNESGRLEQIIGRIFRKEHLHQHPLIVDIQDNFSVYRNQSNGRIAFYKTHFKNVVFHKEHINLDTGENIKMPKRQMLQNTFDEEITSNNFYKNCVIQD
jgi:hypothetical protein